MTLILLFLLHQRFINLFVKDKKMKIYGEANINYKQTEIKSANIFIDFNNNDIDAVGVPSDSLPENLIGTPILKEGRRFMKGRQ